MQKIRSIGWGFSFLFFFSWIFFTNYLKFKNIYDMKLKVLRFISLIKKDGTVPIMILGHTGHKVEAVKPMTFLHAVGFVVLLLAAYASKACNHLPPI